ncbi:SsrA-binding protein [bacterium]|nr:SsrA-binding protein [bacterium]
MAIISKNKKINFLYEIEDKYQAGLILFGDEVKAIKTHKINLSDAYVKINQKNEAELYNFNIGIYKKSNLDTIKHKLNRPIKLLLNKKEISKLKVLSQEKTDPLWLIIYILKTIF